jgi:hypothetical protein
MARLQEEMPVLAECFDTEKAKPEDIARLCMDAKMAAKAAAVAELSHGINAASKPRDVAVYVIASSDTAKVGYAKRPKKRLDSIQVGCWAPLEIVGLFWCINGADAKDLEYYTHAQAKALGLGIRGEWFDASTDLLGLIIATVAHTKNIKVADSAMWLRQREAVRRQVYFYQNGWELPPSDFVVAA